MILLMCHYERQISEYIILIHYTDNLNVYEWFRFHVIHGVSAF